MKESFNISKHQPQPGYGFLCNYCEWMCLFDQDTSEETKQCWQKKSDIKMYSDGGKVVLKSDIFGRDYVEICRRFQVSNTEKIPVKILSQPFIIEKYLKDLFPEEQQCK